MPFIISTNKIYSGRHWTKRNYDKEIYLNEFWIHKNKIKPITEYPVDIIFIFYLEKKAKGYDSSNCSYMGKMIEDCLVAIRVLEDDKRKYVRRVSYQSEKNNGKINYVDVIIKKGEDSYG